MASSSPVWWSSSLTVSWSASSTSSGSLSWEAAGHQCSWGPCWPSFLLVSNPASSSRPTFCTTCPLPSDMQDRVALEIPTLETRALAALADKLYFVRNSGPPVAAVDCQASEELVAAMAKTMAKTMASRDPSRLVTGATAVAVVARSSARPTGSMATVPMVVWMPITASGPAVRKHIASQQPLLSRALLATWGFSETPHLVWGILLTLGQQSPFFPTLLQPPPMGRLS